MAAGTDERIALVIEAQNRASAVLRDVQRDVATLGSSAARAQAASNAAAAGASRMAQIAPQMKQGVNAVTALAFAAESAALGGRSAVNAFGSLAQTLAALSGATRLAALASGVGAIAMVAASAVSLISRIGEKKSQDAMDAFERKLGRMDVHSAERYLAEVQKIRDALAEKVDARKGPIGTWIEQLFNFGDANRLDLLDEELKKLNLRLEDLRAAEAIATQERNRQLREQAREQERAAMAGFTATRAQLQLVTTLMDREREATVLRARAAAGQRAVANEVRVEYAERLRVAAAEGNSFALKVRAAEETARAEQEAIRRQFTFIDSQGHHIALTEEQEAARTRLLGIVDAQLQQERELLALEQARAIQEQQRTLLAEGDTVEERARARLATIDAERDAMIQATGAVETATRIAEQRKRTLYRETARAAASDLGTIAQATINSNNRAVRAIGKVAEATRRFIIGAEAADAAVKSAKQFALVPGRLAVGDVMGAALHAASGTQLAAAAALGFREALGGGGGGAGRGGGGGASAGTFEPNQRPASGGGLVVNLFTTDPYGSGNIRRVMYEINRSGTLNRPIYLPPTAGLASAA